MIEASRVNQSIHPYHAMPYHTVQCSAGKGGDGDKIPGTPMWGCGSCEMGAREERVGVVW
jgi:hypothetical protein